MKKMILGIGIGVCIPLVLGILFILTGQMPVATKGKPLPLERLIAGTSIHIAIGNEADRPSPVPADEINLLAGAKIYQAQCAVCHGGVGGQKTAIAKGLFPRPPQLFEPDHGVTDDPVGESFWKIKNGLRLTGMPGFVDSLTETEMWQVSQLLVSAEHLPAAVSQALQVKAAQ